MAVWPHHSHLPAAAVKEAEGQACPPAPWTNSLWGLLLSTAPGNTGQTRDHNSQKALFCVLGYWLTNPLELHVLVWSLPCSSLTVSWCFYEPFCLLVFSLSYFSSHAQTRDALHFSEDEDAVIVGSLDLCSEYIDDCPWVSVTQYTPQGVRGQPDGSANNKDTVCVILNKCMFWQSSTSFLI